MRKPYTDEEIRQELEKRGCKLVSIVRGKERTIHYIASCGHPHHTQFNNILHGLCVKCPDCSGYRRHTIEQVRDMLEKWGCKLLTSEYTNSKSRIRYIAACGHEVNSTYSTIRRSHGLCRLCAMKKFGVNRRIPFEEIKRRFEAAGCKLLSTEVGNAKDKVRYIATCGHENEIIINNFMNGRGRICGRCTKAGTSAEEHELYEYICSIYKGKVIEHDRTNGREIDIFLPELKLGFEYDGVYWHSEGNNKDKLNLLHKTELFDGLGIRIVHIFDCEWRGRKDIVKSMVADRLGVHGKRYFARKMEVRAVPPDEKGRFLEENHLQGNDKSSYAIGLYDKEDGLVSLMTFGTRKITGGEMELELMRFCNRLGTTVVGGASRLLAHFMRGHPEFRGRTLKTYANRRYSAGGLYRSIGFQYLHSSPPCYYYFDDNAHLFHRAMFQKHKLPSLLSDYSPDRTEWENMQANGYDRVYDCGNMVFSMEIQ